MKYYFLISGWLLFGFSKVLDRSSESHQDFLVPAYSISAIFFLLNAIYYKLPE